MKPKKKSKKLFIVSDMRGEFAAAFSTRAKMSRWLAPFQKESFSFKHADLDPKPPWPKGMRPYAVQNTKPVGVILIFGPPNTERRLYLVAGVWTLECWARNKAHAIKQFKESLRKDTDAVPAPPYVNCEKGEPCKECVAVAKAKPRGKEA